MCVALRSAAVLWIFCYPQSLFPPKAEPPLPLWSGCYGNPLALFPYLEQEGGEKRSGLQHYACDTLWELRDRERERREGGRGRMCVFRTAESFFKSSMRNRFLMPRNTRPNTWHLSCVSSEHWTPCCPVSVQTKTLEKLLPVSSLETIKVYLFTMGQSTCLHTSCTAETTLPPSHSLYNKKPTR